MKHDGVETVHHETHEQLLDRVSLYNENYRRMLFTPPIVFAPNSPTWFNAPCRVCGQTEPMGTCSACFFFDVDDSMVGIMDVANKAAMVLKLGGGVGYYIGELRAKNTPIKTTHGKACGPIEVIKTYQRVAEMITQAGKRDAAQMAILDWDHPDIREFIHLKDEDPQKWNYFNISVGVSDEFMKDVQNGGLTSLELWEEIVESAWKTGDPGFYFKDAAERGNPTPWLGRLKGTNPCLLGSTRMLTKKGLQTIKELSLLQHDTPIQFWTPRGWSDGVAWPTGTKEVVQVLLSNGQRITTTPDHKFVVGEGKMEAGELEGELVEPFLGDGSWENGDDDWEGNELIRLGFLQGDGHRQASGGMYVNIGHKDAEVGTLFPTAKRHGKAQHQWYLGVNDPLTKIAREFGIQFDPLPDRTLPERVFGLSPRALKLFLRGLFSANGTAHRTVDRVSLKSTNLSLVTGVQQLLMALGFRPYITTSKPQEIVWPNGTYTSKRGYDLNIVGSEIPKFRVEIGFVQSYKQQRLFEVACKPPAHRMKPKVIAVVPLEQAEVYDFNVSDETHLGWANGFMVSNCGEVPLLDNEPCNLGSINVNRFVNVGEIDWSHLQAVVKTATMYLDDVLDQNVFPMPEIDAAARLTRKLGLGVMGWADMLASLHIPYDSADAVILGESLMDKINDWSAEESERLSFTRGRAPCFEGKSNEEGGRDFRNATRTCIAPTGSISWLADCSGGIEPHFSLEYTHTMGDGHTTTHKAHYPEGFTPKVSDEIGVEWHLQHQAAFQRHTDLAVSKTINLPNSATREDISQAYMRAWELGLKGTTIFRDGCRAGGEQVLRDVSSSAQSVLPPLYDAAPKVRELENLVFGNGKHDPVRTRLPATRPAVTHRFQVGEQEGYLTVGLFEDGRPGELFVSVSKNGSTVQGLMDSVGILTSVALQYGVPLEALVKKFRQTKFEPAGFTDNKAIPQATSLLDYVFHFLEHQFLEQPFTVQVPPGTKLVFEDPLKPIAGGSGEVCPECGGVLIHAEGCEKCASCDYNRCG